MHQIKHFAESLISPSASAKLVPAAQLEAEDKD
jgi:hypothetical protein